MPDNTIPTRAFTRLLQTRDGGVMAHSDQHLEVEAKLWMPDLALVESRLAVIGGVRRQPRVFEHNIRYENAAGTLTPNGIVLRLRQDSQVRLTYKGPATAAPTSDVTKALQARYEAEVTVGDFETMALILTQLGYVPSMVYQKYRTTYAFNGVEVVLDEMPYGNFVEVEGEPASIEAAIVALELVNCHRFNASYAQLFAYVCANLGLSFTDLTFENFAGLTVPLEAFSPPGKMSP
jgi:adenylate cyclase class 2